MHPEVTKFLVVLSSAVSALFTLSYVWHIALALALGLITVYLIKLNTGNDRLREVRQDMVLVEPSSIRAGNSLAGTTLHSLLQDDHRVNCGIQVENYTIFPLTEPQVQPSCGRLSLPPFTVAPATMEAMVAIKGLGPRGTYGTVSWLIQSQNRRLVVMWSAPYNFNFYSNSLAVGLTSEGVTDHPPGDQWFKQMYRRETTSQLRCQGGNFDREIIPVVHQDMDFVVEGTMNTSHHAVIRVTLKPRNPAN